MRRPTRSNAQPPEFSLTIARYRDISSPDGRPGSVRDCRNVAVSGCSFPAVAVEHLQALEPVTSSAPHHRFAARVRAFGRRRNLRTSKRLPGHFFGNAAVGARRCASARMFSCFQHARTMPPADFAAAAIDLMSVESIDASIGSTGLIFLLVRTSRQWSRTRSRFGFVVESQRSRRKSRHYRH